MPRVPQAIRWALRDHRVAVLAAATGREALGPRVERVPDLVELDITVVQVNGYVVARRLRRTRPADQRVEDQGSRLALNDGLPARASRSTLRGDIWAHGPSGRVTRQG